MLNKDNQRELVYVSRIKEIKPIPGRDRVECVVVNGWTVMVRKDQFKTGDLGIYFEIDSKVPATEPFEFLSGKHYKIKTQGYALKDEKGNKVGKFYSQGLLMSAEDFGWDPSSLVEGEFLTEKLGVVYSVEEDNKRKAKRNPDAKLNAALARHPQIAKKYGRLIKKNKVLKALFLLFFGKKRDNRSWIPGVPKTDEERIENRPWTLEDSSKEWIATEKVDGTSTTFYLKRGKGFSKPEYLVCSRNVVFDTPAKSDRNFYAESIGGNVYLEMSEKYQMRKVLEELLKDRPSAEWVAVQAETFGKSIQKRDYGMNDHEIRAFNLLYSDCGRVGTIEMKEALEVLGVPVVPIIAEKMTLPSSIEELREFVHSKPSLIDGKIKEGIVFRTLDGLDSFKCVDPEFLLKYHQ